MVRSPTRRKFLGAGATISASMLAGCPGDGESGDVSERREHSDGGSAGSERGTPRDKGTETVADGSGLLPARYVVTKEGGEIRSYSGDTLEVEFSGDAGAEDGRVLQETLDATDSGRIYVRQGEYTVDRRLTLETDHTSLHSDFARLSFQDHPSEDGSVQTDFLIGCADDVTEHVEVNGLIFESNKRSRTTETRTTDICNAVNVTLRNCIIFGGKSVDTGNGYGIGEDNDSDFITIDNCVVRDSDRHAYHPSADHHRIVNSTFINNGQRTGDIFDLAGTNAVVANNHFENNGHGIKLDDVGDGDSDGRIIITGNVFVDNYLEDIASGQIEFTEASTEAVLITDNTFILPEITANETSAHILLDTDGRIGTVHLRANHFSGGGRRVLASFTETGRHIETYLIEHNTFENVPDDIGLVASAERLLLRDNLFESTGSGPGRLEVKECGSGVVSGNVTYNSTLDVTEETDLVVEGNHRF